MRVCVHFLTCDADETKRKKNIQLAVEAFSVLQNLVSQKSFNNVHMVLAGGYDPQLPENKEVVDELQEIVDREGLSGHVTFFKSCTEDEKAALLLESLAVVYTPANEHFGIVPIESMFFGKVGVPHCSFLLSPCFAWLTTYAAGDCCK